MTSEKFTISVVIAVYNVEEYLEEAVESILGQDFKEGSIQIILVDDGSTDKSGDICDKYADSNPNITVIHKENGGVASARNAGLELVDSELIYFMDSDDYVDKNAFKDVYKFYERHKNEVDVITIPITLFGKQTGEHWQNFKFERGTRVIDLLEEYEITLSNTNSSFINSSLKKKIHFDERLSDGEDMKVIMDVLLEKMKLGVVDTAYYHYRKHDGSLLDTSAKKIEWYSNHIPCFVIETVNKYFNKLGYIPMFIQYELFSNLQWRFRTNNMPNELIHGEKFELYKKSLLDILEYFDDSAIIKQKKIEPRIKCFILSKKHKCFPHILVDGWDLKIAFDDQIIGSVQNSKIYLEFINIQEDEAILDCMVKMYGLSTSMPTMFYADVNKRRIYCESLEITDADMILNEPSSNRYRFKFRFKLKDDINQIKRIGLIYGDKKVDIKKTASGKFFPVYRDYANAFYNKDNWCVCFENNNLTIKKIGIFDKIKAEIKYDFSLLLTKDISNKLVIMRALTRINILLNHKNKWLLTDRVDKADDNGEALYHYLKSNDHDHTIKFSVNKDCKDYTRLSKNDKIIPMFSFRYYYFSLTSSAVISSNNDYYITRPFDSHVFDDILYRIKHIFLQHGVTKDDVSEWLNKYNSNLDAIVTTTQKETESFIQGKYYMSKENIWDTGFPRHDLLYDSKKKNILVMPTWRKYLNKSNEAGKWSAISDFMNTDYYKCYDDLLTNEILNKKLQQSGYKIIFVPHPNMQKYDSLFHSTENVVIKYSNDVIYRQLLAEASLMITDYSSVAFDFAMLRKPVLYYQFDKELVWLGDHIGKQDYYEYERDGFGEVAYNKENIIELIIDYIDDSCKLKPKYETRINMTFKYNDKENCKRVHKKLIELEKNNGR